MFYIFLARKQNNHPLSHSVWLYTNIAPSMISADVFSHGLMVFSVHFFVCFSVRLSFHGLNAIVLSLKHFAYLDYICVFFQPAIVIYWKINLVHIVRLKVFVRRTETISPIFHFLPENNQNNVCIFRKEKKKENKKPNKEYINVFLLYEFPNNI